MLKRKSSASSSVAPLKRSASLIERTPGIAVPWLVKAEPSDVDIRHVQRDGHCNWTGVRNPVAKNHLVSMRRNDLVLFQVSNVAAPACVAVLRVEADAVPDETQFDAASPYFDERATAQAPKWFSVQLAFVAMLKQRVTRAAMKAEPLLAGMQIFTKARLSVCQLTDAEFARIVELGGLSREQLCSSEEPERHV